MKIRLGELLVRENLLTADQLEEALKYQVLYGGRLGTNLLEMGLLKEDDIARVLSKMLGVPHISPDLLTSVPPYVIQKLPRNLAEKHSAVPLRLQNRRLTLAMADPSDLKAIDEIAFQTGCVIHPVVAPEVRIVQALERYYRVERERRFIRPATDSPLDGSLAEKSDPSDQQSLLTGENPFFPEGSLELEEIDIPLATEDVSRAREKEFSLPEEPEEIEPYTLGTVSDRLSHCADREEIGDILVEYLGEEFECCALFLVRDHNAYGWKARIGGKLLPDFETLSLPLDEPSVLKTVQDSHSYYLGPVPRTPFNSLLLRELGSRIPSAVLLAPLMVHGRLVCILLVTGDGELRQDWILELQKLNAKAAMAFEVLILKNKIRMM